MNPPRRIAVYWSPGRSLAGALEAMARIEPGARLCAIVPQDYTPNATERQQAHEIIVADQSRYSIRDPRPLLRWIMRLRRERFDQLAILFDSPRLIAVAAAAHPRTVVHLRPNGTLGRQPASIVAALAAWSVRAVWGHGVYAVLWLLIRMRTVGEHTPAGPAA